MQNNKQGSKAMSIKDAPRQFVTTNDDPLLTMMDEAMARIGGSRENDVCKYLPGDGGGYMHHFTLKKLATQNPSELKSMLRKYILDADSPRRIAPKARAARGSRKRHDTFTFNRGEVDRLLTLAKAAGDEDMIGRLSPKKSLAHIKRDLVSSVRRGEVNQHLWESYVEAHSSQFGSALQAAASELGIGFPGV